MFGIVSEPSQNCRFSYRNLSGTVTNLQVLQQEPVRHRRGTVRNFQGSLGFMIGTMSEPFENCRFYYGNPSGTVTNLQVLPQEPAWNRRGTVRNLQGSLGFMIGTHVEPSRNRPILQPLPHKTLVLISAPSLIIILIKERCARVRIISIIKGGGQRLVAKANQEVPETRTEIIIK